MKIHHENIIRRHELSDSWVETNIPVWLGRKKKFESSIEFQAYFLDTIASLMISESVEERKPCQVETVGIRARNFRKQLRVSGVSYQDYQTYLCLGLPYFELIFLAQLLTMLLPCDHHIIYYQKSFLMCRMARTVCEAWEDRKKMSTFDSLILKISEVDGAGEDKNEANHNENQNFEDTPDFPFEL